MQPQRTCQACGQALSRADAEQCPACAATLAFAEPSGPSSPASEPSRTLGVAAVDRRTTTDPSQPLTAGTIVARRYRVIQLLGRGGMGEVYKAEDLGLEQTVALKFLPPSAHDEPAHVEQLRQEVRIARRISHPNVCRVHDLGEEHGRSFLSMEYIDGEDLASLLRRIGRLSDEKALEIAHQLCAGLHAAHRLGVVHRDLKPSNVMIDADGRVKITDFGLAARWDEVDASRIREGTPAYMAPEQARGEAVTVRSDVFALGLVLYELFTGKRATELRDHPDDIPTAPSRHRESIDPVVEQVIMRCIAALPEERIPSALAVSAALPGGDPISAALALGELPSPEAVAAAGSATRWDPRWIYGSLGLIAVLLVIAGALHGLHTRLGQVEAPMHPRVLLDRAQTLANEAGFTDPPEDYAYDFAFRDDLRPVDDEDAPQLVFDYRQSPSAFMPMMSARVEADNPPFVKSGELRLRLDERGRLLAFHAVPPRLEDDLDSAGPPWTWFLEKAGYSAATAVPVPSRVVPRTHADERRAFVVTALDDPSSPRWIELATFHGRVSSFAVHAPEDEAWPLPRDEEETPAELIIQINRRSTTWREAPFLFGSFLIATLLVVVILCGSLWLVIRTLRRGEGDRRGARRLALSVFTVTLFTVVIGGHVLPHALGFVPAVGRALPIALLDGALTWILYIALEPYARRFWPRAMISWTRLLQGRWQDPLLGRDCLLGFVCGVVIFAVGAILASNGIDPRLNDGPLELFVLNGPARAAALPMHALSTALATSCQLIFAVLVLRLLFRRQWLAIVIGCAMLFVFGSVSDGWATGLYFAVVMGGGSAIALLRGGFVGLMASEFAWTLLAAFPWTLEFDRWYAGTGGFGVALLFGLALLAARNALRGANHAPR